PNQSPGDADHPIGNLNDCSGRCDRHPQRRSTLFPGRRGGQHLTSDGIQRQLRRHQIPALTGRAAAIRHLVLQAPARVVARMLGYTYDQTARLATEAGSPWSRYGPEPATAQPQEKVYATVDYAWSPVSHPISSSSRLVSGPYRSWNGRSMDRWIPTAV
ncbi:hypothetical protein AB0E01_32235, partial [Nocardia vinacea]